MISGLQFRRKWKCGKYAEFKCIQNIGLLFISLLFNHMLMLYLTFFFLREKNQVLGNLGKILGALWDEGLFLDYVSQWGSLGCFF